LIGHHRWTERAVVGEFEGWYWKRSIDAVVVEIGGNKQSRDPSTTLLLKLVLQVVNEAGDDVNQREPAS
jgi:hypothetical protein